MPDAPREAPALSHLLCRICDKQPGIRGKGPGRRRPQHGDNGRPAVAPLGGELQRRVGRRDRYGRSALQPRCCPVQAAHLQQAWLHTLHRFTASRVASAGALVSARRRQAGRGRLSSRTKADVQDAAVVCAATLPHRLRLGAGCVRRKGHPRRRHRAREARPASRPLLLLLCEAWPGEAWITAPGLLWFTDPSYATCHAPATGARALRQARARP